MKPEIFVPVSIMVGWALGVLTARLVYYIESVRLKGEIRQLLWLLDKKEKQLHNLWEMYDHVMYPRERSKPTTAGESGG